MPARLAALALIVAAACRPVPSGIAGRRDGGSGGAGGSGPCAIDADGDGFLSPHCGGDDCVDDDAAVRPGATEVCGDEVDENCDGARDEGCLCIPGDRRPCVPAGASEAALDVGACRLGSEVCLAGRGWSACEGAVLPLAEPAACDGIDQDCDGEVDEAGECAVGGPEICGNFLDDDGDGTWDPLDHCDVTCRGNDLACCYEDEEGNPADRPAPWGPCVRVSCADRMNQPCYTGPPGTLGKGICRGGVGSCWVDERGSSQSCENEVLPEPEVCGDAIDNDCDGRIDEASGASGARCPLPCVPREETCNGEDDDCDGFADETCVPGAAEQVCYAGPAGTRGVGACRDGVQRAGPGGWGPCSSVGPAPESCGDGVDSDCDRYGGPGAPEDAGCCMPSGPEVCNGEDDDCNGLVDDGVLNACGTCDETCTVEEFHEPGSCLPGTGRECSKVVPDSNNPDAFTLSSDRRGPRDPSLLLVPVPDARRLVKLDGVTGERVWTAALHGDGARDVLVAPDASAWVGGARVEHLDRDGNLICVSDLPGPTGGMALDVLGDVWVVTEAGVLYRNSGFGVEAPGEDGLPRCTLSDLRAGEGRSLDLGVAVDGLGMSPAQVLWTGSSPAVRLDTRTLAVERVEHGEARGVLVDWNGDAWFGGDDVHRVAANPPYDDPGLYLASTGVAAEGLSLHPRATIWGTHGSSLVHIDMATLEHGTIEAPGAVRGTALDPSRIWALGAGGAVHRFDPGKIVWETFEVSAGHELARRGDLSGHSGWHPFQTRTGIWTQRYDSGYRVTDWRRLDWQQLRPEGSLVEVHLRFADTAAGLDAPPVECGPFVQPPVDLHACEGAARKRWIAITFLLRSARDGRAPVVGHVQVHWSRR